jgi:hypothetical protein
MGVARLADGLARRFKGLVGLGVVTGLLSAAWLGYLALRGFGWSLTVAAIAGSVLALPAAVLGWLWILLDEVAGMPRRVGEWIARIKEAPAAAEPAVAAQTQAAGQQTRPRLLDMRKLGGLAVEMASMGWDVKEVFGSGGSLMVLTNPVSLIVFGIAAVVVAILDFGAIIAGLIYLLG